MHIKTVGSYEAKTHLPALLDAVEQGDKIVITRRGVPVAILVPFKEPPATITEVIKAFGELRKGLTLGGLSIKDLKNEGRKF